MSRRLIFGGPSELYPDEYPTHPPLVELGYGEHAAHNPDYDRYAGLGSGVAYGQEMPEEAQRGLVYNANQDMQEALDRDGVPKKKRPGAMGSYWAQGAVGRDGSVEDEDDDDNDNDNDDNDSDDNIRRGHQIYLGSSMKQKHKGDYEVALESGLHDQLAEAEEGGELPEHRRNYQCAEPGLLSDYRYENAWDDSDDQDGSDEEGGRFYVEDREGNHLPPCGDGSEYGCRNICEATGDEDLEDDSDDY